MSVTFKFYPALDPSPLPHQ